MASSTNPLTPFNATITFNPRFVKEQTSQTGKYRYCFNVASTEISIEGATIGPDTPKEKLYETVWNMPAQCTNTEHTHPIMTQWLTECVGFFTKPPPLSTCLANVVSMTDPNANATLLAAEEELKEWIMLWKPTRVVIEAPKFILYWAPVDKKENARINEEFIFETMEDVLEAKKEEELVLEEVRLDLDAMPAADLGKKTDNFRSAPLNLAQKKDMERVIHAYEKARLAYEKAEEYNERFYKKYGFYAVEDSGSETSSFQSSWSGD